MANIGGTTGNDTLTGTTGADRINGGAGNDSIYGGAGADILYGGVGYDFLDGGTGADYIVGGADDDVMMGREGTDTFAFWFGLAGTGAEGSNPEGFAESNIVSITTSEGNDIILDFDHRAGTADKLDFNGLKSGQYDYLVASGQMTYSHADYTGDGNTDMLISWAGGSLILSGITENKIGDLATLKSYILFDA